MLVTDSLDAGPHNYICVYSSQSQTQNTAKIQTDRQTDTTSHYFNITNAHNIKKKSQILGAPDIKASEATLNLILRVPSPSLLSHGIGFDIPEPRS